VWPVSDRFLAALTGSHAVVSRVEAWRGDTYIGRVPISAGTVTITSRNRVRRTLQLTVPEDLYPAGDDDLLLSPAGTELRAWRGIDFGDDVEWVPVFRGRIQAVTDEDLYDAKIEVVAQDRFATVNDARFEIPRAAPAGVSNLAAIRILAGEAISDLGVLVTAAETATVPAGLSWDKDRGQAIDDLADANPAEVYFDAGGTLVIRTPPSLTDPIVWTPTDGGGDYPVVSKSSRTVSRDGVYNVVVTTVERPDGQPPIRSIVEDTEATSLTWASGPFGRVPRFYASPLITSQTQADDAGRALLARSIGRARTRQVACVPNPAAEAGDLWSITVGGGVEFHLADVITLPLTAAGGPMVTTTRSTRPDPGDITK
jgi:hypothetical protein